MPESKTTDGYKLMIEFPDQSPSFVHGFETGRLWERLGTGASTIVDWFSPENFELIKMMCGHFGYTWEVREEKDGWLELVLEKGRPKLGVVQ